MSIGHIKSNTVADATGTVTYWWGATTATGNATDFVRPSDWNSVHNQMLTLSGNTSGQSTVSGTNIIFAGGNAVTLSASQGTNAQATVSFSVNALAQSAADLLYYPRTATTIPNGFPDRTGMSLSWDNGTRTLTVAPTGTSFDLWSNGTLYTKSGSHNTTIANTTGLHYIYYDDSGTLTNTMTFGTNLILRWAIVAIVYWNATDGNAVPDLQKEWHGTDWPPEVHLQQHLVAGCRFQSGILPTVSAEQDGSNISHIQVAVTTGYIWDEDIQHTIASRAAGDNVPIMYRSGASGDWSVATTSSAIVRTAGTGRAAYNQWTGATWQQTEMTDSWFGISYLYALPSLTTTNGLVIVQGQAQYETQSAAGAAAMEAPDLGALPLYEMKLIAAFVYQTDDTYTNAVKSRIVRITDTSGDDFVDWRYESAVIQAMGGGADAGNVIAAGSQTALVPGTVMFSNSNGMTFGMNNSSVVTASYTVPSTAGLLSAIKISAGTASNNLSALTFSNSNGLAFGLNGSVITGSYTMSSATISAGTTSGTLGQIDFGNANNATFGLNAGTITVSAPINFSAGTVSNNLTALTFSNSNGMSFGLNGGTITGSYTVPTQSAQTVGRYALGNTTGQSSSSTWDARSLSIAGAGIISVGNSAGSGLVISATQSNQALSGSNGSFTYQTATFGALNGLSFYTSNGSLVASYTVPSVPAQTNQTLGLYAVGNTTGQSSSSTMDARTLSFVGQGIASVGFSNGSVNISVPSGGGAGDGVNIIAAGSQTANTTGSVLFQNSNGITFGMSNSSVVTASYTVPTTTISFADSNGLSWGVNAGTITGSHAINVSAGTTSGNVSALTFNNSNGVTFGYNNGTITASAAGGAGGGATVSLFKPINEGLFVAGQQGQGTLHVMPVLFPDLHMDRLLIPIAMSNATNNSGSHTISYWMGIYTKNASTLSSLHSTSFSTAATMSGTAGSYSLYSGLRNLTAPWSTTITAGQYWVAIASRTTSGGANGSYSQMLMSNAASNFVGVFGAANTTTQQRMLGFGVYTATTSGVPSSIAFTQIRGSDSLAWRPPIYVFQLGTV